MSIVYYTGIDRG